MARVLWYTVMRISFSTSLLWCVVCVVIPQSSQYRHFYAPEYRLEVLPSNTENLNSQFQMHKILERITENFRSFVFPIGAQLRISRTLCMQISNVVIVQIFDNCFDDLD